MTVLAKKGQKNVHNVVMGNEKENCTVLLGFNAAGEMCPPLSVIAGARVPPWIRTDYPEDWSYQMTKSGWMTGEAFFNYIAHDFLQWVHNQKIPMPIIVFIDGHSSHMTLSLSEFCSNNKIILVCLYLNATHVLQPMDVGFFKPLKQNWRNCRDEWNMANQNQVFKRENLAPLLKTTIKKTLENPNTIQNAFRTCGNLFYYLPKFILYKLLIFFKKKTGLYPFDVNAVNYNKLLPQNILQPEMDTPSTSLEQNSRSRESRVNPLCHFNCQYFPDTTPINEIETVITDETGDNDLVASFQEAFDLHQEYEGDAPNKLLFKIWRTCKIRFTPNPPAAPIECETFDNNVMEGRIDPVEVTFHDQLGLDDNAMDEIIPAWADLDVQHEVEIGSVPSSPIASANFLSLSPQTTA